MSATSTVRLRFGHSRSTDGQDIGALIRRAAPEADVRAELDGAGAVRGYELILSFADADQATEALFRLRDFFVDNSIAFEVL